MIGILGARRVILLLVLALFNAVMGALVYTYLVPEQEVQQRKLRQIRGEVSTLRGDISRMQVEFEQLELQKAEFQRLEADGFFKNQSRKQAENTFNAIQKKSGVNLAVASIEAGVVEDNKEAAKAKYKVLKSPMTVSIEAVDDVDIYHYLFLIENYFPGHVSVENLSIEREADISNTVLRGIASGVNPPLVKAQLDMVWRTMIPESEIVEDTAPQAPQGGKRK